MAYVQVPKDLNAVKTKVLFNLTKRQLICFGGGALIGIPLFFLLKGPAKMSASGASICMLGAEAAYAAMEAEFQNEADNYETLHPGYDEYRYDLDKIGHDPYVLISILTAWYGGENGNEHIGIMIFAISSRFL